MFCVWELRGREEGCEWVAHHVAPGNEVIVHKKARWAIPKEDSGRLEGRAIVVDG
jgi:hypothetical protein